MKKYLCLVIALLLLLSACGRKAESKPAGDQPAQPAEVPDDAAPTNPEPAPEEEQPGAPVQHEVKEPEPHHPYEWLGLSGMPECNYSDILSTNHYYQVYDTYSLGTKAEVIEAADGIDAYQKNAGTTTLTVGGMIYSISESARIYMQYDMTDSAAQAKASMEYAMENGVNMKGRAFNDTGASAVPLYAEAEGDTAEYEYYEFLTSNPGVSELIERFFMKDGDVFAIYSKTTTGENTLEHTDVIKSITADIPAGTFDIPDLSGYTRKN